MNTENGFARLGIMLDCSRNAVMHINALKKWIDIMSDLGYNTLMLYTEDTYEVQNQPYFGYMRGRYTESEIREIDGYANEKGIELIPAIQTLAHLNSIFRWKEYSDIRDCNDILLSGEEKSYKLIDDMFKALSRTYSARIVNIGMDEAHMLGRGKYQDLHGFKDRFDILLNHLNRVSEIAQKYGFKCIMWGDMFFRLLGTDYEDDDVIVSQKVKELIPDNVDLVYWDYYALDKQRYANRIKHHNAVKEGIWFAGGLWSWTGFAPHNGFSIAATEAAFSACREEKVKNVFLTMWGDDGAECSRFSLLPSLYYAAKIAKGNNNEAAIKKGFYEKFGIEFDDFLAVDLPSTANEANDRVLNPEKYMLYNDCFMGILDSTVRENDALGYKKCAERLSKIGIGTEFEYIFKSLAALCEVLAIKFDIGLRTREAYSEKDFAKIDALIEDYKELLTVIDRFYNTFRLQWETENKPHGFDVQDLRIGGLYFRVRSCIERLECFKNGEIKSIPELEEDLLDFVGADKFTRQPKSVNNWKETATVNIV